MTTTKRVTFTIPKTLIDDLDYLSNALEVSRSGLVSELLTGSVPEMRRLLESMIPADSLSDSARLSRNPDLVRTHLNSLSTALDQAKSNFDKESQSLLDSVGANSNGH